MMTQHTDLAGAGTGAESPSAPRSIVPVPGFSGAYMLGWIKAHRKMMEWTWYKESDTKSLFLHLLLIANHKETRWMGVTVHRGQCITGLNSLSYDTGISKQSVRTGIRRLISTHEITIKPTQRFSIVTICNYDIYQGSDTDTNTPNNTPNGTLLTHRQHTANNIQECKEGEECKNKDSGGQSPAQRPPKLTDEQWLDSLQLNEAYRAIAVRTEYAKMFAWCDANGKKPTRRRFVNWLNRYDIRQEDLI
jgi:hypothetical protein